MTRILLAGVARSGTTWAANVLGRAHGARTVFEPDGPYSDLLGAMVAAKLGEYPALRPESHSGWYRIAWDLAFSGGWPWDRSAGARAAGRRLLRIPPGVRDAGVAALSVGVARLRTRPDHVVVKTVNSLLSLEWICSRYQPAMVVMYRDPLNIVSSWSALRWQDSSQPLAMDPRVQLFLERLGIAPPGDGATDLARKAWTVGFLSTVLKDTAARHPDWIVVSFDQLSARPREGFQELFSRLGLEWTAAVDDYLVAADRPGYAVYGGNARTHPNVVTATEATLSRRQQQSSQWKRRLTAEQADEVSRVLEQFPLGEWGHDPVNSTPFDRLSGDQCGYQQ